MKYQKSEELALKKQSYAEESQKHLLEAERIRVEREKKERMEAFQMNQKIAEEN